MIPDIESSELLKRVFSIRENIHILEITFAEARGRREGERCSTIFENSWSHTMTYTVLPCKAAPSFRVGIVSGPGLGTKTWGFELLVSVP